uniref:Uncharacterized protein n=1 Tax=Oryza glumipatula TaxID=40148 RepID=A0A0E0BVP8_9ORYZ
MAARHSDNETRSGIFPLSIRRCFSLAQPESLLSRANNSGRRRASFSGETLHRRDSSSGEKALASQAPTRGRGGWHRGSRCNDDEAASRQRGHTAPSRRGQGGSKVARLTGRGGAEAEIRLLLLAARRPPAVAWLVKWT